MNTLFQSADWKQEKHVPVIEAPESVDKGKPFSIMITVGKGIAHPNKTEHHISWIEVFFRAKDEKFPYNIGRCEFAAHGGSTQGPDTSTVYTEPAMVLSFRTEKPGTIFASSYCNIHGLWQGSKELNIK